MKVPELGRGPDPSLLQERSGELSELLGAGACNDGVIIWISRTDPSKSKEATEHP